MISISSILKIFMMPPSHRKIPPIPEHPCGDDSTCIGTIHKIPPVPCPPVCPPQHKHITMIVVSFAVAASLLFGLIAIIWWYCHRQNVRISGTPVLFHRQVDSLQEDDHGVVEVVDHPIWLINTAGLDRSVIDSIEVCEFKKGDGLIDGVECTICLGEFEEGEDLRLLPKCSHAFHVPCIDTWLRSHKNCPLCRAPIVRDVLLPCEINLEESRSNRGILDGSSMTVSGNDDAGERNSDGEAGSRGENRARKENGIRPQRSLSLIHSSSVMVPRLTTAIGNHSRFAKEVKNVRGAVCTRNNDESSCNKIRKSSSDAGILSFEKSSRETSIHLF